MAFNIMDLMNATTKAAAGENNEYQEITLGIRDIVVTKHNKYSMDGLKDLAAGIEMDGLQEPLVLGQINGEYWLISGHRRMAALNILVTEGKEAFETVKCRYKQMTETEFRIALLVGNTFNRKMTDYDLMTQAAEWKEVLTQARKEGLLILEAGERVRDYVAAAMGETVPKIRDLKKIAFNSKKSDGFNPQMVVNDEMEAWPGDQRLKQYEVMTSALGARKQPLILSISTAGYINDGIYDELMRRATSFLKGNSKETRILPFLYMIDDIEKWDSIEELKKSNPNLGISVSEEFYIEQIEIARASLSKKVEFLTKYCNIKQNSSVAWLDYWDVMKAVKEDVGISLEEYRGCYCVGGIDLSRTTDLTAASIVIWKNGKWNVITKFYMPKKRYEVAVNEDNVPYNIYREKGFLEISGENQVYYKDVYKWFIDLVKVYKIRPLKIGYDRYSAGYLVDDLKMAGFQTDDVYQGTNLTPILNQFEGDLKDGKYNLGDNTLLASHFLNVAVEINMNDSRMKPVKIEKRMRIDGAVSVFDAMTMVSKYHSEIGKKLLNEAA